MQLWLQRPVVNEIGSPLWLKQPFEPGQTSLFQVAHLCGALDAFALFFCVVRMSIDTAWHRNSLVHAVWT